MYPTVRYSASLRGWWIDDGTECGNTSVYDSRDEAVEVADSAAYDYARQF